MKAVQQLIRSFLFDDVARRTLNAVSKAEEELKSSRLNREMKDEILFNVINNSKQKPIWLSRKFQVCLIGVLVPILNKYFGWQLDEGLILQLFGTCIAAAGFQALSDIGKNK